LIGRADDRLKRPAHLEGGPVSGRRDTAMYQRVHSLVWIYGRKFAFHSPG
jgi:hypothetical protein